MNNELLQQCIASGQVSADQIEAHHRADELPITFADPEPSRFDHIAGRVIDGLVGVGLVAVVIATWYFS